MKQPELADRTSENFDEFRIQNDGPLVKNDEFSINWYDYRSISALTIRTPSTSTARSWVRFILPKDAGFNIHK